jgi:hypothetical protein
MRRRLVLQPQLTRRRGGGERGGLGKGCRRGGFALVTVDAEEVRVFVTEIGMGLTVLTLSGVS